MHVRGRIDRHAKSGMPWNPAVSPIGAPIMFAANSVAAVPGEETRHAFERG